MTSRRLGEVEKELRELKGETTAPAPTKKAKPQRSAAAR
jgi:hypothetical protein